MVEKTFGTSIKNIFAAGLTIAVLIFFLIHNVGALVTYPPGSLLQPGDVTSSHIRNATILDVDIATTSAINLFKIGQGTSGAIPFFNGTLLNATTTEIFWDISNNRFGVASSSPSYNLSVEGNAYVSNSLITGNLTATGTTRLNGVTYTWPSADGTNGQVIQTNGAGTFSFTDSPLSASTTVYTTSSTYAKPSTAKMVHVRIWGGGGGGGRTALQDSDGVGGGGGGGFAEAWFRVANLAASETVTIGAGGAAIASDSSAGNAGGNTTFSTLLTAYGGGGGGTKAATATGGAGGCVFAAGETQSTTVASPGAPLCSGGGTTATTTNATYSTGGGANAFGAGNSYYGGGGGGGSDSGVWNNPTGGTSVLGGNGGNGGTDNPGPTCQNGTQPGGGGGGYDYNGITQLTGCKGGDGQAIITTYF